MNANPSRNAVGFITLGSSKANVEMLSSEQNAIERSQRTEYPEHGVRPNDSVPLQGKKEGDARRERNSSSHHLLHIFFTSHPEHFMLTSLD
jgi:hypothetical protein